MTERVTPRCAPSPLDQLAARRASHATRGAVEARIVRLVLVGMLASFTLGVGVTVASDLSHSAAASPAGVRLLGGSDSSTHVRTHAS